MEFRSTVLSTVISPTKPNWTTAHVRRIVKVSHFEFFVKFTIYLFNFLFYIYLIFLEIFWKHANYDPLLYNVLYLVK